MTEGSEIQGKIFRGSSWLDETEVKDGEGLGMKKIDWIKRKKQNRQEIYIFGYAQSGRVKTFVEPAITQS